MALEPSASECQFASGLPHSNCIDRALSEHIRERPRSAWGRHTHIPTDTVYSLAASPVVTRYFSSKYTAEVLGMVPIFFPFGLAAVVMPDALLATMQ